MRYDGAIARGGAAAGRRRPRGASADYVNRGILLDSMGRHEGALADYDEALRSIARSPRDRID